MSKYFIVGVSVFIGFGVFFVVTGYWMFEERDFSDLIYGLVTGAILPGLFLLGLVILLSLILRLRNKPNGRRGKGQDN